MGDFFFGGGGEVELDIHCKVFIVPELVAVGLC